MRGLMKFPTTVVLLALLTTPMLAATTHTGGGVSKVTVVTETKDSITSSSAYVQLPGAVVHITVPAGTTQLVRASFTAESICAAQDPGGWCSVRIVAVNAADSTTELSPKSGFDFAFDSVSTPAGSSDRWEGNAMDRSIVLGAGDYAIRVQWGVIDPNISFRLDDWSFTVQQHVNGL
jgi:hypothetical protein